MSSGVSLSECDFEFLLFPSWTLGEVHVLPTIIDGVKTIKDVFMFLHEEIEDVTLSSVGRDLRFKFDVKV